MTPDELRQNRNHLPRRLRPETKDKGALAYDSGQGFAKLAAKCTIKIQHKNADYRRTPAFK